jgi:hypothetical protein
MDYPEYEQLKAELLDTKETLLRKKVTGLENKLYDELTDKFIAKLDGDRTLANTKSNIAKLNYIDRLWEQFVKDEILPVIKTMVKGYSEIMVLNTAYYQSVVPTMAEENAEIVKQRTFQRFGISENGQALTKGGFLESFVKDTGLRNEIKQMTLKAIISPVKPRDIYIKEVRELVKGTKELQGGFAKHFDTFAYDSFAQFDRSVNVQLSKRVGMGYAVYAGGLVKESRDFCIHRNGKVFTNEQITLFGTAEDTFGGYDKKPHFQGKNRGYDPFIDLGGHRCRHTLNYISNSLAKKRLGAA